MQKILEIQQLTKYYGDICGIKDLSLELKTGEIFGFIGPNGAGKSTTIRSIMNLINKTSGEIIFQGQLLTRDKVSLKKDIGYLPSEIYLYDDLTVKEILDYHESFYEADIHSNRQFLVAKLQLDESKKVEDLSLGNKKKLGIILAMMHEPKLLILDEPTSGLDPLMQEIFYDLLRAEKAKGTTIFYSTHILREVNKICDRVGIIKDGVLLDIIDVKDIANHNLNVITLTTPDIKTIKKRIKEDIIYQDKETIKFTNKLAPNDLIALLSNYNIKELLIEEANMEDLFFHYYK